MSKSCAFLERKDGSRYVELFRALHLHGITHSKFYCSEQTLFSELLVERCVLCGLYVVTTSIRTNTATATDVYSLLYYGRYGIVGFNVPIDTL